MNYYSTQGWIYITVSIIATLLSLSLNLYLEGPGLYLIAYIVYLLVIALTAYNITCLTRGECHIWSWIVSLLSTLPMLSTIALLIYIMIYGKSV